MTLQYVLEMLTDAVLTDSGNAIEAEYALRPELVGIPYFDAPLLGCAAADDELFRQYKEDPKIYGSVLRLPEEWMPGARSVISFFLPYTAEIRTSSLHYGKDPSETWLHARIEGQAFLLKICHKLADMLHEAGYDAVIPADHPDYRVERVPQRAALGEPPYVSNWSERHVAYVAGLGTFSLSKNIITEKGVCGRFGSIITDAPFAATERTYSDPFEYCTFCGLCNCNCPADAISVDTGKDLIACSDFLDTTRKAYAPRYGCGKCQMGVPCETGIPGR